MLSIYRGSEDLQEVMVIDRSTGTPAWHCVYISQLIQNTEKRPGGRLCWEPGWLRLRLRQQQPAPARQLLQAWWLWP